MSSSLILTLLFACAIGIRGNPTNKATCNKVDENMCEVLVYDPDLPIISDEIPAESMVEVRLMGTVKSKLSSNVCTAFPNAQVINAIGIGLKEVAADSFRKCSKLTAIYLDNNEISSLDTSLFDTNHLLERLEAPNNTIKTFDASILNHTPKLQLMFLSDNEMEEFILGDMSTQLNELRKIELQNNKLKSLDLREFEKKFPNLRTLIMCEKDVADIDAEKLMTDVPPNRRFLSLYDFDSCE